MVTRNRQTALVFPRYKSVGETGRRQTNASYLVPTAYPSFSSITVVRFPCRTTSAFSVDAKASVEKTDGNRLEPAAKPCFSFVSVNLCWCVSFLYRYSKASVKLSDGKRLVATVNPTPLLVRHFVRPRSRTPRDTKASAQVPPMKNASCRLQTPFLFEVILGFSIEMRDSVSVVFGGGT